MIGEYDHENYSLMGWWLFMETSLRRYTELPCLIDYLQTKELALLNPALWDDRNDSYYIEMYAQANSLLRKR